MAKHVHKWRRPTLREVQYTWLRCTKGICGARAKWCCDCCDCGGGRCAKHGPNPREVRGSPELAKALRTLHNLPATPNPKPHKAFKQWRCHMGVNRPSAIIFGRGLEETWIWLYENVSASQTDYVRAIVRALNAARVVLPKARVG